MLAAGSPEDTHPPHPGMMAALCFARIVARTETAAHHEPYFAQSPNCAFRVSVTRARDAKAEVWIVDSIASASVAGGRVGTRMRRPVLALLSFKEAKTWRKISRHLGFRRISHFLGALGKLIAFEDGARFRECFAREVVLVNNGGPDHPVHRILTTICLYAVKDGATAISMIPAAIPLEEGREGLRKSGWALNVEYQIDGEWFSQMTIPSYVLHPLSQLVMARSGMDLQQQGVFPRLDIVSLAVFDQVEDDKRPKVDPNIQLGLFQPPFVENDIFWPCEVRPHEFGHQIQIRVEDPLDNLRESDPATPRTLNFRDGAKIKPVRWPRPSELVGRIWGMPEDEEDLE